MSSFFGILSFVLALFAIGSWLVIARGARRSREMLVLAGLLLTTLHRVVPMPDRIESPVALLAALMITYALWDQHRRGNAPTEDGIGALTRMDLRHVMLTQEAYRRDHGGYATGWVELQGATGIPLTPSNIAEVVGDPSGYRATVRSDGPGAEPTQYSVYVGTAADTAGRPPNTICRDS
jgi:hypothetical protein